MDGLVIVVRVSDEEIRLLNFDHKRVKALFEEKMRNAQTRVTDVHITRAIKRARRKIRS